MTYTLIRTGRRTLSMKLTPEGGLVVRAPKNCPSWYIDHFVDRHMDWVERNRETLLQRKAARENLRLCDGQELLLCGKPLRIRIEPNVLAAIRGDELILPTGNVSWIREDLIDLMKQHGLHLLRERLIHWECRMRITCQTLKISTARSRWGSCDRNGVIRISVFLLLAPTDLIDYILVHELSHRKHHDHGAAFWALVATMIPDWKEKRARLRAYQHEPLIECLAAKEE